MAGQQRKATRDKAARVPEPRTPFEQDLLQVQDTAEVALQQVVCGLTADPAQRAATLAAFRAEGDAERAIVARDYAGSAPMVVNIWRLEVEAMRRYYASDAVRRAEALQNIAARFHRAFLREQRLRSQRQTAAVTAPESA